MKTQHCMHGYHITTTCPTCDSIEPTETLTDKVIKLEEENRQLRNKLAWLTQYRAEAEAFKIESDIAHGHCSFCDQEIFGDSR